VFDAMVRALTVGESMSLPDVDLGLHDAVARIVTDSRAPGEPKETEGSALVAIHDAFASPAQRADFHTALRGGLAWGAAKQQVVDVIEAQIGPMRAHYDALMAHPEQIEAVLQSGAAKARAVARPFLESLRRAVGLRPMLATPARPAAQQAERRAAAGLPSFKQYREQDGLFYFKLVGADGGLLLQSLGLPDGREAGAWVKRLKSEGRAALPGAPVQRVTENPGVLEAALDALVAAQDA
jgi:tryptophanyl-tRNA synthetase